MTGIAPFPKAPTVVPANGSATHNDKIQSSPVHLADQRVTHNPALQSQKHLFLTAIPLSSDASARPFASPTESIAQAESTFQSPSNASDKSDVLPMKGEAVNRETLFLAPSGSGSAQPQAVRSRYP